MYKIFLNNKSKKFLDKIKDKKLLEYLLLPIKKLEVDPHIGKKLKGYEGLYCIKE